MLARRTSKVYSNPYPGMRGGSIRRRFDFLPSPLRFLSLPVCTLIPKTESRPREGRASSKHIGGRQRVESAANRFERLDTNWHGGASGVSCRVTCEKVGVGGQTGIAAILVINLHINRSSM